MVVQLYHGLIPQRGQQGKRGFCSSLVGPHLQSCLRLWCPHYHKDVKLLGQVQRRCSKGCWSPSALETDLERPGGVQPGVEKALGTPQSNFQHLKGLQDSQKGTLDKSLE